LSEDVEGQTLGAVTPIGLLRDLEDQFGHAFIFAWASKLQGSHLATLRTSCDSAD
jgi:hypothetical protein